MPPGLILDPKELLQSSLLKEIIEFGKNYIEASKDGDNEKFDTEIESWNGGLLIISDDGHGHGRVGKDDRYVNPPGCGHLPQVVRTPSYLSSLSPIIDVAFLRLVLIAYGQQQDMMMEVDIWAEKFDETKFLFHFELPPGQIHGCGLPCIYWWG